MIQPSPIRKISVDELSKILSKAVNEHFKFDDTPDTYKFDCQIKYLAFAPYENEDAEVSINFKYILQRDYGDIIDTGEAEAL